jgi:hypothetical protein
MAPKESKICKEAAAGIKVHIMLTISESLDIIRKPGNARSQSVITAAHKIGFMTIYGKKESKKKITCK